MATYDETEAQKQQISNAIETGAIGLAKSNQLAEYSRWLCKPDMQSHFNGRVYEQICETVRLQMQRAMFEEFERRGKFMQWLVVALATASLLASIVQIAVAITPATQIETPCDE